MTVHEGIIIKTMQYQEQSKLVHVLTIDKFTTLLAKGARNIRSKNTSYTQELTKIRFDVAKGRGFDIITTGEVVSNYTKIKNHYQSIQDALSIFEFVYHFHEHVEDYTTLYQFLDSILTKMEENPSTFYPIIFQLKLLYLLGVAPTFYYCISCKSKENLIGFVIDSGGMKCTRCLEQLDKVMQGAYLETLSYLYHTKLVNIDILMLQSLENQIPMLEQFIRSYYYNHLKVKCTELFKK